MKNSPLQFGLRSLLGVTLLVAVFFAGRWSMTERARRAEHQSQRLAKELFEIAAPTSPANGFGTYVLTGTREEVERRQKALELLSAMGKLPPTGEAEAEKSDAKGRQE